MDKRRRRNAQTLIPEDEGILDSRSTGLQECFVVIVFHPDTSRIGQSCSLRLSDDLTFGRNTVFYASAEKRVGVALDDPYVSRNACRLHREEGAWRLSRESGRSRLRVDGIELTEPILVSDHTLRCGVVLTLGQRVVLHLRFQTTDDAAETVAPLATRRPVEATSSAEHGAHDHSKYLAQDAVREALLHLLPGVSQAMENLREAVRIAARSPEDVLLCGPTGTGKERAARALHELGSPPESPWVAVNMSALPPDIAAASLFGVRRGAYTGADAHRQGFFQQAQGGTLFLDEIADAPASVQPQLLRALQEREVQVLGGAAETVQLRVVAAMETDPDAPDSPLRASLRFRLGAQEIRLPKLADRREDIGLHAATAFREFARQQGTPWAAEFSDPAEVLRWVRCFELLVAYPWPGNVRELLHAVEQIAAASEAALQIPKQLRMRLSGVVASSTDGSAMPGEPVVTGPLVGGASASADKDTSTATSELTPEQPASPYVGIPRVEEGGDEVASVRLADLSDDEFRLAWEAGHREVASVARNLGVSRTAIYRRLQKSSVCRLAADVPLGELLAVLDECRGDLATAAMRLDVSKPGLEARLRASGVEFGVSAKRVASGDSG